MNTRNDTDQVVTYPGPVAEKCLRLEAPGAEFDRAMISIPTVLRPGESFAATVSLLDKNAMPIISRGETLRLFLDADHEVDLVFPSGCSALARVSSLCCEKTGFFRLQGQVGSQSFVSNPALVTKEDRSRIVWGDPHIHTTVGDCHPERCRTRNLAYAAARHAYGLGFVAIADHVSWNPRGTPGKWFDNLAACELYNEPPVFSTLYCYETSMRGGDGGDCNVYLRQPNPTYVDPWPDEQNLAQLCEEVEGEFFAVPHHTTRTGKHGEIPAAAYPGEQRMPVVEIHSKWGTSEYRGNPTPLLKIHPGPSYVQDLLAQGYRFGFIGGTDSHTSLTFCRNLESEAHRSPPGLTAALVDENNRDAVYRAIQARRCYAACGERIFLDLQCDSLTMGESGSLPQNGKIEITGTFAAESEIVSVELIRNNEVVYRESPDDWKGELHWVDDTVSEAAAMPGFGDAAPAVFYYLRVTAQADARAWSSPCWFDLPKEE